MSQSESEDKDIVKWQTDGCGGDGGGGGRGGRARARNAGG